MLKKLLCIVMVTLMAVTLFAACGPEDDPDNKGDTTKGAEDPTDLPSYTFRLAETHAEEYPTTLGDKEFARLVSEKTDGRITIEVFANSVLGDETEVIEKVTDGGIDFTRTSTAPMAEFVPKLKVLGLPYIYKSGDHMWNVLEGDVGKEVLASLEEEGTGLVGLCWYDGGSRNFYLSSPVTKMADLQGKKIRVQESQLMMGLVEAVGGVPDPIPFSEVYSALKTGVIDGAENNFPSYLSKGHYEGAKHFIVDGHTRIPEILVASQKTMDKLSEDDQQAIRDAAWESMDLQKEEWAKEVKKARDEVEAAGCIVTDPSPEVVQDFQDAVMPLYDEFAADYKDLIEDIKAVD